MACAAVLPLLFVSLAMTTPTAAVFSMPSPWGYVCVDHRCMREARAGLKAQVTLNECKLTCGTSGALWPRPKSATLANTTVQFLPSGITLEQPAVPTSVSPLIREAYNLFLDTLHRYHPRYQGADTPWHQPTGHSWPSGHPAMSGHQLRVQVTVRSAVMWLTLTTDESYELVVRTSGDTTTATITAATFFGARHGMETLTQLMAFHELTASLIIVTDAVVHDAPAFPYRGLMLDTSRNFYSVAALQRTLDAMAANKLNTFHWHITDSQSFPLYLQSLPNMAYYGAYSSDAVYHPRDIKHLMQYARVRGIRLLPELDVPAHVGYGWQWGEHQGLGKLAVCVNKEPWQEFCPGPPCGQLNLANPNTYIVLGKIFNELAELFMPLDLFHYGGDEVNLNCWNTTEEMRSWMVSEKHGLDAEAYYWQWAAFQEKARNLLTEANGGQEVPGILWTSRLTDAKYIERFLNNSKYIIQIWTSGSDSAIGGLLKNGYRVIFSNHDAWYLDCGFGATVGDHGSWCGSYKEWETVYANSPYAIAQNLTGSNHTDLILGGEAAMWSEQVDEANLDTKVWPRTAALAERLWTNPSTTWRDAESRFIHHRQRLLQLGVQAERIQPAWCHLNEGFCYAKN